MNFLAKIFSTKSKTAKIQYCALEVRTLHRFVSCLVEKDLLLAMNWLDFDAILIIKTIRCTIKMMEIMRR